MRKHSQPLRMEEKKYQPSFGLNEILILHPQMLYKKHKQNRVRKSSIEQLKKVLSKKQEIFVQQEAISDYLREILTDRTERYQQHKMKQIQNKAKYACDYNYKWKQKLEEQKCLSAEREISFYEEYNNNRKQHSQSYALPKIKERKHSEPVVIAQKQPASEFMNKLRKIVYCSYQKELKHMKRSFEIAAKLEQDDFRIMKYKTLDVRPKFPPLNLKQKRNSQDTFITS